VYAVVDPDTGVNSHVDPSPPVYTTPAAACDSDPAASRFHTHPEAGEAAVPPGALLRLLYVAPICASEFTPASSNPIVETIRFPVPASTLADTRLVIGNDKRVAFGRCPVTPVVAGPDGKACVAATAASAVPDSPRIKAPVVTATAATHPTERHVLPGTARAKDTVSLDPGASSRHQWRMTRNLYTRLRKSITRARMSPELGARSSNPIRANA
jgi:hypothetical protein